MVRRTHVWTLVLALGTPGCGALFFTPPSQEEYQAQAAKAQQEGQARQDEIFKKQVDDAIAKAQTGGPREVVAAALALEQAYVTGVVGRKVVPPETMDQVIGLIEREMTKKPQEKADLLVGRGRLEIAAGKKDAGVASLRASIDARPTVAAFLPLVEALDQEGQGNDIVALAKRTIAATSTPDQRYEVLFGVMIHTHASSIDAGLAWASAADRKLYADETARREAEGKARSDEFRKEQQENSARMQAEFKENDRKNQEGRRCKDRCDADGSACRSHCSTGGFCITDCEDSRDACKRSCN